MPLRSTEQPWTLLGSWGPTPRYGVFGFNAIIPEMNKVVAVIAGPRRITAMHTNPAMIPLTGVNGCNGCQVNQAAYEAFLEAQTATQNWAGNQAARGAHIFSVAGSSPRCSLAR